MWRRIFFEIVSGMCGVDFPGNVVRLDAASRQLVVVEKDSVYVPWLHR